MYSIISEVFVPVVIGPLALVALLAGVIKLMQYKYAQKNELDEHQYASVDYAAISQNILGRSRYISTTYFKWVIYEGIYYTFEEK